MKSTLLRLVSVAAWGAAILTAQAQMATTIAGSGTAGYTDGTGAAAAFTAPLGLCTDATNLYIADGYCIRKIVLATGQVTTVAGKGTGSRMYHYDQVGTTASLAGPSYMYFDAGSIYFCDQYWIRKFDLNSNWVGTVKSWPALEYVTGGIAKDPTTGTAYFSKGNQAGSSWDNNGIGNPGGNMIWRLMNPTSGNPEGFEVAGNGTLSVAGYMDGTGVASPGSTTQGPWFNGPQAICLVGGYIYVADTYNNRIRKVAIANGQVTTFAGSGNAAFADGTGTAASFNQPRDICANPAGNTLYVADTGNHRIRKIAVATGAVTTYAGGAAIGSADGHNGATTTFDAPAGICLDSSGNKLYVTDLNTKKVRMVFANATTLTAGSGTAGSANGTGAAAQFNTPRYVVVDKNNGGNSYVIDWKNNVIRKVTGARVVTILAGSGVAGWADGTGAAASFNQPQCGCVDIYGQNLYVADTGNHSIRKVVLATGVVTTIAGGGGAGFADGTGPTAKFNNPCGLDMDPAGNVYVADYSNNRIRKVTPSGVVTTVAGSGVAGFGDGTAAAAVFKSPFSLCFDSAGDLYVADTGNQRIRKIVVATGAVSTLVGSGAVGAVDGTGTGATFNSPYGISADKFGRLFVADTFNNKIRCITIATKKVVTIAGTGTVGATDAMFAAASTFNQPYGVCADRKGNLYVADTMNHKVRKFVVSWDVDTSPLPVYTPQVGK